MHGQLGVYRSKTKAESTKRWIEEWWSKIGGPTPPGVIPAVDNPEDWVRLRGNGYGKVEVLKLCDVGNKLILAQRALMYENGIRALAGLEDGGEQGVMSRLARYLLAPNHFEPNRSAYAEEARRVDWIRVAQYFSRALEHGGQIILCSMPSCPKLDPAGPSESDPDENGDVYGRFRYMQSEDRG